MNVSRRDFVKNLSAASIGGVMVGFGGGCKYIQSIEQIGVVAVGVGKACGLVCNLFKIDDKSRGVIIEIMGKVRGCVPATGDTFNAKWMKIAEEHVQTLIDRGDITKEQGGLILVAFALVAKGIDYLFTRLDPKVREMTDLILAGIGGFCDGFLSTFKPASDCQDCTVKIDFKGVDMEAYKYLKTLQVEMCRGK